MVKALQDAMRRAESLSESEQEALAAIIEAELEDESRWQKRFSETDSTISKVAERAKKQYQAGECEDFRKE